MHKRRRIYEAPEKIIYEGASQGTYVQFFKDDDPAGPAAERGRGDGKAALHNRISEYIFTRLNEAGLPNYFIKSLNMREQLVHSVEMIPLKILCRNIVSPALAGRLGLEVGAPLPRPLFEFYYTQEGLGGPLVSDEHILTFGWAHEQDLEEMLAFTARINDFLCGLFTAAGLRLVEFAVEFGRLWSGDMMQLLLASEISPDSCLLWRRDFALAIEAEARGGRQANAAQSSAGAAEAAKAGPKPGIAPVPAAANDTGADKAAAGTQARDFAGISHKELALRLGLLKSGGRSGESAGAG